MFASRSLLSAAAIITCEIYILTIMLGLPCNATLLAASKIETCIQTNPNEPLQGCTMKFMATLSVQNSENATESIVTYSLTETEDNNGVKYDMVDTVEVYLAKSAIDLVYPLRYQRNYNNQPFEVMLNRDQGGRSFNWLTNPCIDDPAQDGACGWVLDSNNARVAGSNGFCCRCDLSDFLSGSNSGSRANLQCALFSSSNSQSAHCIRMSPLWYSAYSVEPYRVQYNINAIFRHCRGGNSTAATDCRVTVATIGPSSPVACVSFSGGTACDAHVSLEGDFAAFDNAPSYESKLLMVPTVCDDFPTCGTRITETAERWMLVDQTLTTLGSDCNKIGVSYTGFQAQPSRCQVPVGSCIRNQLQNLYDADAALEAEGRVGSVFVKNYKLGGMFFANVQSPSNPRMTFRTNRYQRSVVSVSLRGDSIRYIRRVAPGQIVNVVAPTFEAMSADGRLSVTVANIGSIQSQYTVTVECEQGILPISAQQITLSAPPDLQSSGTLQFPLQTSRTGAANYLCIIRLQDGLYRLTDMREVTINVTAMVSNAGGQQGSVAPNAPQNGDEVPTRVMCDDCGRFDILCAINYKCYSILGGWGGGILAAAMVLALLLKYPWLLCTPCKVCSAITPSTSSPSTQQQPSSSNGTTWTKNPSNALQQHPNRGEHQPHDEAYLREEEFRRMERMIVMMSLASRQQQHYPQYSPYSPGRRVHSPMARRRDGNYTSATSSTQQQR